jgi:glycosyltransferase involved in cell wall biosynthesis
LSAEVLLVDGASTDESRAVVAPFLASQNAALSFRLLDNPSRTTPFGFNIGIAASQSEIVGFGGAHTIYPPTYLRRAVEVLHASGAEVVGGGFSQFISSVPGTLGVAMSCLYQSPFGAGVAGYLRRTAPGFVDTVYGGFYRRTVFDKVGRFDERLTRNQDNELNSRVKVAGLRIYFHPDLSTSYVQKTDLPSFLRRGMLFGRYHPVTWRANIRSFRLRHAIPALFVLFLSVLVALAVLDRLTLWLLVPFAAYLALLLWSAVQLRKRVGARPAILTIPVFFLFHVAYGLGTLVGLASILRVEGPNARQRRAA